jgi:hypothetical protein
VIDTDRQTLPSELVDDIEHAELPAIVCPALSEVIGPDMIGVLGPKPDARPVIQPQPTSFGLLLGDRQSLPPPDAFDTFGILVKIPASVSVWSGRAQ